MVTYLIKSTLCLTLFLAFYHLVLEREKMHRFNRFYLLSAVFISFLAPLYTIYIKVIQEPIAVFTQLPDENITFTQEIVAIETPINYWNYVIYFSVFVSAILLVRFFKNLYAIYKKVSISEKFKHQSATIVLVVDEILPHTFWNYIFINKATYESKEVEQELFTHELTHVAQKHTFDVLFVELLKVVFWFNPIFYFLKKSVQLNHEFLADTKVVTQHKNVSKYQHLLINTSAWSNEYAMASNLHYLVTKKRIIMMTKQTSKAVIALKKVAVLSLVLGAFFLFAERVEAQESVETIVENVPFNSVKTEDFDLYKEYYYKKLTFIRKDENGNKISKKYNELSKEEKERLAPPPALNQKEKTPSKELIENLKDNKKYALWIDGKVVKNTDLSNYKNIDFSDYFVSFVYKNARSKRFPQEYQANLSTKKYFETQNKKRKEDFLNWVKKEHNIKEIKIKSSENKTYINKSTPEYKYTKQTYWIKDKNGKKVAKKYYELSDYYKKKWLIFPPNPKGEKAITTSEFNSLKDALNYVVRINGVVINNNELANYTTNNFVSFSKSKISSLAKLKQQYHYNLITKKGFKLLKSLENSINKIRRNSSKQSIASESVVEDIKFKLNNADVLNLSLTSKDTILPPPPPKRTSTKIVKKGEKSNIPPPPSPMVKKGEISNIPPPPSSSSNQKNGREIGSVYINNETLYYVKENGKTQYFNRWGKQVDKNGKEKETKKGDTKITGTSTSINGVEKGWKQVGDKTLYYVKENGKTLYFNRYGKSVDKKGKEIKQTITIDKIKNLSNKEISELKYETNNKNVTYYLNKKIISKKELSKLDPKVIDKMNVIKNKDGSGSIYITTKKETIKTENFSVQKTSQSKAKNKWVVGNEVHVIEDVNLDKLSSNEKSNTAPKSQKKIKNKWVVGNEVHIIEDVNLDELSSNEKSTSKENIKFIEPDENLKKNYFIEDKKTSKKEFYTHFKDNKDYHFGSAYTNKEKSIINMYISKSQDKIIKLMQKGY